MKTQILDKQSFQISEEDSKRITSLRFLLIIFVVFIHANLTPDDALNYYHYDFIRKRQFTVDAVHFIFKLEQIPSYSF